jgi:hypothetical protein
MNTHSDFHKEGLFAVKDASGNVLTDTFATTAYSARSEFVHRHHLVWGQAQKKGYTLAEFAQIAEVVDRPRPDRNFSVPKTASEWQLYTSDPKSGAAAQALGERLEQLLRIALAHSSVDLHARAKQVRDKMYEEMDKYQNLGATDTEPECVLVETIERVLGLPPQSLGR